MKRKPSLSAQMFRSIALLLTGTQLLLTLLCILLTVRTSRQRTLVDQKSLLTQTAANLGNLTSEFTRVVYYLSGDQAIPETLEKTSLSPQESALAYTQLRDAFFAYTSAPITAYKLDYRSYLFLSEQFPLTEGMKHSVNFSGNVSQYVQLRSLAAIEERPWLEEVISNGRMLVCFIDSQAPDSLFFANEIQNINLSDVRFDKNLGVAVFQVKRRAVLQYLKELQGVWGAQALLMDGDTVLLSTDEAAFPVGEALDDAWRAALEVPAGDGLVSLRCASQRLYVGRETVNHQLSLLFLLPAAQLESTSEMLASTLAGVGISLLLLSLLLSRLVAGRVTRPIRTLTERMKRAPLELTQPPAGTLDQGSQELQTLYESYDQMISLIQELMKTQREHLRNRQRAELHAMQAQINPHFIYNTLDTVNALALLNGQEEISDLATELSDLLKYAMRFQKQTVELRTELSFVEKYARIQQIRLDRPFILENRVSEDLLTLQIPKLSLQPLVENAIFYARSSEPRVTVRLEACRVGEALEVRVLDSGTQCPAQRMNEYLRGGAIQPSGEGIGVRNVHERIRLQYGERFGLRYEQNTWGGLTAVLRLPAAPEA